MKTTWREREEYRGCLPLVCSEPRVSGRVQVDLVLVRLVEFYGEASEAVVHLKVFWHGTCSSNRCVCKYNCGINHLSKNRICQTQWNFQSFISEPPKNMRIKELFSLLNRQCRLITHHKRGPIS